MNILIRGVDSFKGYQTQILDRVWEKVECEKCVIISRNWDNKDKYGKRYLEIPYNYANDLHYEDVNNLLPVSEVILNKMKAYEGRIFETAMRECNISIFSFEECKKKYYHELFFWHNVLKKQKIDFIIFHNAPHMMHDYVIYCLGQVMEIPMLLFMPTFFQGRLEWGTSYDNLGQNTGKRYRELLKEGNENIDLPIDLQDVYDKYRDGLRKTDFEKINRNYREMYDKAKITTDYVSKYKIKLRRKNIIQKARDAKSFKIKKKIYMEYLRDVNLTFRCRKYIKQSIDIYNYRKYDKLKNIRAKEQYVYFGLQVFPESSLMPKASAFYEQRFSISILAKATQKLGMKLYVKEHWAQSLRDKEFYEFLRQFRNIRLFGPNESNIELIKNCIAVSTATGSCIIEGMFNGIPAITFGDGFWSGVPGEFRVHSVESCYKALLQILRKEYIINDYKIKKYLQAVAETTIPMNLYQTNKFGSIFSDQESVENISEFLIDYLLKYNKKTKV